MAIWISLSTEGHWVAASLGASLTVGGSDKRDGTEIESSELPTATIGVTAAVSLDSSGARGEVESSLVEQQATLGGDEDLAWWSSKLP